jgi:hypothetical protein
VQRQLADLTRVLSLPRRPHPVLVFYRWRYEIALAIVVPLGLVELVDFAGLAGALVVLVGGVVSALTWPPARRVVVMRWWCVVVQHRLRRGFAQARVCTLDGRLPAIIWASPKPAGVQVLLWCPAGVDVHAIAAERHVLAAACFATDVVVEQHERYANVVGLFVAVGGD